MDEPEKTYKMVSVQKPWDLDIKSHVKLYNNVLENDSEDEGSDREFGNQSLKEGNELRREKYVPIKLGRNFRANPLCKSGEHKVKRKNKERHTSERDEDEGRSEESDRREKKSKEKIISKEQI